MTYEIKLQVGSPHVLRDHLREVVVGYSQGSNIRHTLEDALAQIEEQVKTTIEEPTDFGSLVRAKSYGPLSMLWQRSPENGKHYWESDTGAVEVWSALTDVEVLRVGVGGQASNAAIRNLLNEIHYLVQAWESIPAQRVHDLVTAYEIDAASEMQP